MIKQFNANRARLKRHLRMRSHMEGSQERPRLSVFRSGHHIYAQIIDDTTGQTLAAASSLEETLRSFKPEVKAAAKGERGTAAEDEAQVETAAEAAPAKGKGAKQAPKAPAAKGAQPQKGGKPAAQVKTVLAPAQKGSTKTQVEALSAIAGNRKVAVAREVGKLVAQRAKEKGVSRVVFDRGGYAYHGRVAALAEGAREVGLNF
jgi:ribosomal protein L18